MISLEKTVGQLNAMLSSAYFELKARRKNRVPLPPRQAISVEIFLSRSTYEHGLRDEAGYEETKTALWEIMNRGDRLNQYLLPRAKKFAFPVWVRIVVQVNTLPIFTPEDMRFLQNTEFLSMRQLPTPGGKLMKFDEYFLRSMGISPI